MDASCKIQGSIHGFRLVYKYVSRILGTYHFDVICCALGGLFNFAVLLKMLGITE